MSEQRANSHRYCVKARANQLIKVKAVDDYLFECNDSFAVTSPRG